MFRCRRSPPSISLAGCLFGAAAPVLAQSAAEGPASAGDEAVQLDRITVTAQKREQQVEDVPAAISAYSGDFLQRFDVRRLDELGTFAPGVLIHEQAPNNSGFMIRGITSDDGGEPNQQPRVSVFQDGVSINQTRGNALQPFDLERVELLRGPQGTLFGRSAQVGAIHFIQNKARNETSGSFTVGLGNYDQRLFTGYVNAPLVEDRLFGRLAVYSEQRDGYIDNIAGGDLNGKDTQAIRASFGLDVGDRHRLDLILNYQKDSPPGLASLSPDVPTRAGPPDIYARGELNRGEELGLDRTVRGATLLGDFFLNDSWSLSTITGWRDFDAFEEFDADGAQVFALEFADDAQGRQFSQELRFNYDNGENFRGFVGASYYDEDGSHRVPFRTDERSFTALISPLIAADPEVSGILSLFGLTPPWPVVGPDGTPDLTLGGQIDQLNALLGLFGTALKPFHEEQYTQYGRTKAYELFADGTWSIGDRWELTAGVRGTREELASGYRVDYFGVPSGLSLLGLNGRPRLDGSNLNNILFQPTDGTLWAEQRFHSLVARAVASYRFSDDLNGYASVSRGRRPAVILWDFDLDSRSYRSNVIPPEIVLSYEVGLKGDTPAFGGSLSYDVALYYYDYTNFQTTVVRDLEQVTVNGGNAHAGGLELALLQQIGSDFSAFFNYTYTDGKFNAFDEDGNPQDRAGNSFRLTSRHSASAGVDWQFDLGAGDARFYLRPSWNWRSHHFFEDDNQPGLESGGYALYNLKAGVRFDDDRWDVGVFAHNLGDKEHLIDAGNTGLSFGTPTVIPGSPHTYGVMLTGKF